MNTRIGLACCVALLGAAAAWNTQVNCATGQDKAQTIPADKAEELRQAKIHYAQAILKVARADLAKAIEADSKIPGTIPGFIIRGLQNDVAIDSARLQTMLGTKPEGENPYVLAAKEALTYAEDSLRKAGLVNARAPGAVSAGEVERREAEVEMAKAQIAVAKLLDDADPLEIARWELMQLQQSVHDLRYRVRLLQYRN
ncbi:MAG: hypothetical protein IT427_09080 [Pirellulales bacterium]|nr:hypothetical protein [Pirellulales bacterium]